MINKDIMTVYFSGTGNTKYVAESVNDTFEKMGLSTELYALDLSRYSYEKIYENLNPESKLLIIIYPVYAFTAPQVIFEWINGMPHSENQLTVAVSVSGGGEVWPNSLSRVDCIKSLEKKGCNVFYEDMLVMPSNILVETNDHLSMWLLKSLPEKINKMISLIKKPPLTLPFS